MLVDPNLVSCFPDIDDIDSEGTGDLSSSCVASDDAGNLGSIDDLPLQVLVELAVLAL